MSTPPSLPPPDSGLEVLILSVTVTRPGDDAPSTIFSRNQADLSVRVSWQTKLRSILTMLSGTWRLNFQLESLTSADDRDLGDFSVPVVPGSLSYTEEAKINIGSVTEGVYKLVTSVSFLDPKGSSVFVGFDEQVIQIVSD